MTLRYALHTLNSLFHEANVFSIGKHSAGHPDKSSAQQNVQIVLSTKAENQYSEFIKMLPIKNEMKKFAAVKRKWHIFLKRPY